MLMTIVMMMCDTWLDVSGNQGMTIVIVMGDTWLGVSGNQGMTTVMTFFVVSGNHRG